jgi:hypothetical protein
VGTQRLDFAEFYRSSRDDCLRTVVFVVGDQDNAQELVAEAFARACASWRTVSRHPAPAAWVVRTALNLNISRWRRRHRELPVPNPGMLSDRLAAGTAAQDLVDPQIMAALLGVVTVQVHNNTPLPNPSPAYKTPAGFVPADIVTVINPAKMPSGTELFFGYVSRDRGLFFDLIYTSSYTCSGFLRASVAPVGS